MGYEHDYVHLITEAGFELPHGSPAWTDAERNQAIAFRPGPVLQEPVHRGPRHPTGRRRARHDPRARHEGRRNRLEHDVVQIAARAEPRAALLPRAVRPRRATGRASEANVDRPRQRRDLHARRPIGDHGDAALPTTGSPSPKSIRNGRPGQRRHPASEPSASSGGEANYNLLTEMPWELDQIELPDDFPAPVGPIFAHIDAPIPDVAHELATEHRPLVYLGLGIVGGPPPDAHHGPRPRIVADRPDRPCRPLPRTRRRRPRQRPRHRPVTSSPHGRADRRRGPARRPRHRPDRMRNRRAVRRHGPPTRTNLERQTLRTTRQRHLDPTQTRRQTRLLAAVRQLIEDPALRHAADNSKLHTPTRMAHPPPPTSSKPSSPPDRSAITTTFAEGDVGSAEPAIAPGWLPRRLVHLHREPGRMAGRFGVRFGRRSQPGGSTPLETVALAARAPSRPNDSRRRPCGDRQLASRSDLSLARSLRLARRIAGAISGATSGRSRPARRGCAASCGCAPSARASRCRWSPSGTALRRCA